VGVGIYVCSHTVRTELAEGMECPRNEEENKGRNLPNPSGRSAMTLPVQRVHAVHGQFIRCCPIPVALRMRILPLR